MGIERNQSRQGKKRSLKYIHSSNELKLNCHEGNCIFLTSGRGKRKNHTLLGLLQTELLVERKSLCLQASQDLPEKRLERSHRRQRTKWLQRGSGVRLQRLSAMGS